MARHFQCPVCRKAGVTLRLRRAMRDVQDHYQCRYCGFFAYPCGSGHPDTERMSFLQAANPGVRFQ